MTAYDDKLAHLSHKFRATEEDSILNFAPSSPSPNVLWLPLSATVDETPFGARIASLDRRTPRWTRCIARRVLLGFQRRNRRNSNNIVPKHPPAAALIALLSRVRRRREF